jgi:hypothetical protein
MASKLWDRLGTWKGRLGALSGVLTALVAIGGLAWSGATLLATDKEVEVAVEQVDKKVEAYIDTKTLYDARLALKQTQFLLLDESISPAQRALAEETKAELIRVIECVQAGRDHCEQ